LSYSPAPFYCSFETAGAADAVGGGVSAEKA